MKSKRGSKDEIEEAVDRKSDNESASVSRTNGPVAQSNRASERYSVVEGLTPGRTNNS